MGREVSGIRTLRTTHTVATLDVSAATYKEIAEKLNNAGYDDAFIGDGIIDMTGIGLVQGSTT